MPSYLELRRRRWYAKLDIPKKLRTYFNGKPRFFESLQTESKTIAEQRVRPLIAQWKAEIEAVRTGNVAALEDLRATALEWREMLEAATGEAREELKHVLEEKAREIERRRPKAGRAVYKIATGQWVSTGERVAEWLETLENEPKTVDMKRSDLARFTKRFRLTRDVERLAVIAWAEDLRQRDGLALPTVRRIVSHCRGYWQYLQRHGVVAEDKDPFRKVVPPKPRKQTKAEIAAKRRTFSSAEVVKLLRSAVGRGDIELGRLIWLGMWTGCRIEELCSLPVEKVSADRFNVEDAKSEAGWREVPIHPDCRPLMADLCASSADGYLLSGLTNNKYADRSNAIGKRFGRLKTALGFSSKYVFHSLRKTVASQFEANGVPEHVAARVIGHDIPTMTYGVYSSGVPFEIKLAAVEKLSYPLGGFDPQFLLQFVAPRDQRRAGCNGHHDGHEIDEAREGVQQLDSCPHAIAHSDPDQPDKDQPDPADKKKPPQHRNRSSH